MRDLALNSLLVMISLAGLAACLEVGIRIYSGFFFPKMMVLDDALGWRHARDVEKVFVNDEFDRILVKQNVNGHRGNTYPVETTPGAYRVLVLGDSFTEGVQVAETDLFTSRFEQAHSRTEVLNAGVGGYGTVQEYLYLMSEGFDLRPDAVLLTFFNNDLKDNCSSFSPGFGPRPYAVETDGEVAIVTDLDPTEFSKYILPIPLSSWLNEHSYLYNVLNSRLYQRLFSAKLRELKQQDSKRLNDCGQYRILFDLLLRIKKAATARDVNIFVLLIPSVKEAHNRDGGTHQAVLDFCEVNALQCLSLVERMHAEIVAGEKPYFEHDIHWTRAGHRIAAEELSAFITFQESGAH